MSLQSYLDDYGTYHRHPGNQSCHMIGVPMIFLATLSLFSKLTLHGFPPLLNAGLLLWALASVWYLRQGGRRGAVFAAVSFPILWVSTFIPAAVAVALFVIGWIIQGIGHYHYEKRSPAFYKNAEHLLVGPVFVFEKLVNGK